MVLNKLPPSESQTFSAKLQNYLQRREEPHPVMVKQIVEPFFPACAISALVVAISAVDRIFFDAVQYHTQQILMLKLPAAGLSFIECRHSGAHHKDHAITHTCQHARIGDRKDRRRVYDDPVKKREQSQEQSTQQVVSQ